MKTITNYFIAGVLILLLYTFGFLHGQASVKSGDEPVKEDYLAPGQEGMDVARTVVMPSSASARFQPEPVVAVLSLPRADVICRDLVDETSSRLSLMAAVDPEGAVRLAMTEPLRFVREEYVRAVLATWSGRDPERALEWALDISSESDVGMLEVSLRNGSLSLEFAESLYRKVEDGIELSSDRMRQVRVSVVAGLCEFGKYESALAFAESFDQKEALALRSTALSLWSRFDPLSSIGYAVEMIDANERERALGGVVSVWAEESPATLADFALSLPEGKEREHAMSEALRSWTGSDPETAARWIGRFPPSRELDVGVLALATQSSIAERNPRLALRWAEHLSDENLKADQVANVVKQWAASDRPSAIEYLKNSPDLRRSDRDELLSLFGVINR